MANYIENNYCNRCGHYAPHRTTKCNHLRYFFISVISCGLWFIPWFFIAVFSGDHQCMKCGAKR